MGGPQLRLSASTRTKLAAGDRRRSWPHPARHRGEPATWAGHRPAQRPVLGRLAARVLSCTSARRSPLCAGKSASPVRRRRGGLHPEHEGITMNVPPPPSPPRLPVPGSSLASYTAANGNKVLPGCYGVSPSTGLTGELIRHATESWAGHAFVYIGNGQIIEAAPPVAKISSAASHPDAVWNVRYPLTGEERDKICDRRTPWWAAPTTTRHTSRFALEVLKLRSGGELDPVFKEDHWRVCSALVADCYAYAGADLEEGLKYPDLISPADLYNMIAHEV